MTFTLNMEGEIKGIFIHTPKCAGTSTQLLFKSLGFDLQRPNKEWIGHHGIDLSLSLIKRHAQQQNQHKILENLKVYVILRDPSSWLASFYSYALKTDPRITGLKRERNYFRENDIYSYLWDYIQFSSLGKLNGRRQTIDPATSLAFKPFTHYFETSAGTKSSIKSGTSINIFSYKKLGLLKSLLIETYKLKDDGQLQLPHLNHNTYSAGTHSKLNLLLESNPALSHALASAALKGHLSICDELTSYGRTTISL